MSGWVFLYMFVILKIPVIAAILLVWWAVREQPEATDGGHGGSRRRDHPRPRPPRPPRRGPHGDPAPPAPERVRTRAHLPEPAHRGQPVRAAR